MWYLFGSSFLLMWCLNCYLALSQNKEPKLAFELVAHATLLGAMWLFVEYVKVAIP